MRILPICRNIVMLGNWIRHDLAMQRSVSESEYCLPFGEWRSHEATFRPTISASPVPPMCRGAEEGAGLRFRPICFRLTAQLCCADLNVHGFSGCDVDTHRRHGRVLAHLLHNLLEEARGLRTHGCGAAHSRPRSSVPIDVRARVNDHFARRPGHRIVSHIMDHKTELSGESHRRHQAISYHQCEKPDEYHR